MHKGSMTVMHRWLITSVIVCALIGSVEIAAVESAMARGGPEYMKLRYVPGIALEIKGVWDTSGVFVATEMEQLPKPRTPKMRGAIQRINKAKRMFMMLGRPVRVKKSTRFLEVDSSSLSFESLKVGQRIEVSCTVLEDGTWKARKIRTKGVKRSDKIKGTITRVAVDGNAPDTLEMSGLLILLTKKTDINWPRGDLQKVQYKRFKYAALSDAEYSRDGELLSKNILLTAKYRGELENLSEPDLSPTFESDRSDLQPGVRAELTAFLGKNVRALTQIRWRKKYDISSESQSILSKKKELDVTQLYALFKDIGNTPFSIQVGRQDVDEPREWLFDEYLDALRLHYIAAHGFIAQAAVIVSVAPIKRKFEPWTDYFAQFGWRFDRHSAARVYVLARNDTSPRNRDPVWWGARYYGRPTRALRSWFDVALMRGEDKGRTQRAWAFDVGSTLFVGEYKAIRPNVTLGYAVGSGDKVANDNFSQEFRQTSYQDNVGRIGGVTRIRYYGEALNPELSNLKIFTAGAGLIHERGTSLEALYHSYRQHRLDADLSKTALTNPPAVPNGASADIGWGLDIIASSPEFWERFQLRYTFSIFNPGVAFEPRNETALLNRLNFDVTL